MLNAIIAHIKYGADKPHNPNIIPTNKGPIVSPKNKNIPFTDIKTALSSIGGYLAIKIWVLGTQIPCAKPNMISGNKYKNSEGIIMIINIEEK